MTVYIAYYDNGEDFAWLGDKVYKTKQGCINEILSKGFVYVEKDIGVYKLEDECSCDYGAVRALELAE